MCVCWGGGGGGGSYSHIQEMAVTNKEAGFCPPDAAGTRTQRIIPKAETGKFSSTTFIHHDEGCECQDAPNIACAPPSKEALITMATERTPNPELS